VFNRASTRAETCHRRSISRIYTIVRRLPGTRWDLTSHIVVPSTDNALCRLATTLRARAKTFPIRAVLSASTPDTQRHSLTVSVAIY
jgi:hypothetical protein